MDKPIQIIVKGERCSGKSTIVFLLKQFFRHLNIHVIFDSNDNHYRNEDDFDDRHAKFFMNTMEMMCTSNKKIISIKEEDFYSEREYYEFMKHVDKNRRFIKINKYKPKSNIKVRNRFF